MRYLSAATIILGCEAAKFAGAWYANSKNYGKAQQLLSNSCVVSVTNISYGFNATLNYIREKVDQVYAKYQRGENILMEVSLSLAALYIVSIAETPISIFAVTAYFLAQPFTFSSRGIE